MPRRHRRRDDPRPREARRGPATTPIPAPPGWTAERYRATPKRGGGASAEGPDYTCPRCHRGVHRGSEHVVAWPADERDEDAHRHWHSACWTSATKEGIDRYRWA